MYSDLLKKVHKVEIKAKGLSKNVFSGQYRSAFKGRGMTFSEVREYSYGDEIRSIDWNVSARFNHPFVKIFEEERELTIMLMIDVSGSTNFGTNTCLKTDTITEIAAILAFSAISNNDKVGAILFSDKVELYIPPKKGSSHCLRIIRELLSFKRTNNMTSFKGPFEFLNNVIKKRCTCFLITDGFGTFDKGLQIFSRKHDVCSIIVNDPMEFTLADIGMVLIEDCEKKSSVWIDSSDDKTRKEFEKYRKHQQKELIQTFTKFGIDYVNIKTNDDYTKALIKLFANRERL
jgi:uncharacterized protein (DUF58 family)